MDEHDGLSLLRITFLSAYSGYRTVDIVQCWKLFDIGDHSTVRHCTYKSKYCMRGVKIKTDSDYITDDECSPDLHLPSTFLFIGKSGVLVVVGGAKSL